MKNIKILLGIFVLCFLISNVSADTYYYSSSGCGTFSALSDHDTGGYIKYENDGDNTLYCVYTCYHGGWGRVKFYHYKSGVGGSTASPTLNNGDIYTWSGVIGHRTIYSTYYGHIYADTSFGPYYGTSTVVLTVSETELSTYTISGNTSCLNYIKLYMQNSSGYIELVNDTTPDTYTMNVLENETYKLKFSNGEQYEFTPTDNIIYDYNACKYMVINLKDYCGNKMSNTSVDIYKSDAGVPASYEFVGNYHRINPISLLVPNIGEGKMLDIYFDTDMGSHHQIEYCIEQEIDILHPSKYWAMTFEAYDIDTELPIENMRITVNQSCVIDPTHPLKQYLFTGANGKGTFIGLSASVLSVMQGHPEYMGEVGYTSFVIDPFGDAFCTYWSIDTYFNKSSGEDYQGNVSKDCNIHFKDQNGYVDNHINDTDTYVDLYYDNGNCSATLKFQRLYGTYWMSKMSWNIPINESGYKRVYNTNFSEYDANYRGYMYATECSCNATMPLYVMNETVQEEQHYENLSTYIRFNHQMGASQIDYRSPVEITTYAYTNTSAYLLNINLTLYEQTAQIATVALDWADFAGASPKWYYTWAPSVNYDIGKNYTVVMAGYNGLNLGADEVWTSNIRNNKLTIYVKDNHNSPINYATVFIEGWGSHALESSTDIEITGFDNGDVQYKATKSGYTSSGWATVTFNDDDETVTCILIKESTTRVTGYKLRNDEIKDFFIPVMYLLLMFMLIGAFFHVAGKR